jgi:regulator of sigma E protease
MILDILKFILICIEVVLIFNLMILVHELGHYLAARWRGLVVEKFAIWFGKPIWKKTIGGVEYRLGCIPAGGFVAIPQLAPMEMMEGDVENDRSAYPPIKPIDKIIVAFAGPAFSFGLAILFAVVVWVVGRPVSESELTTKIGFVVPESPAAEAGMAAGDRIVSINGIPVSQFGPAGNARASIVWNIARSETPALDIVVDRDGKTLDFDVTPEIPQREGWGRKNLRSIGVAPAMTPKIASIIPGSPAQDAGLRSGDLITTANGMPLISMVQVSEMLKTNGAAPVTLGVTRGAEKLDVVVTPEKPENEEVFRIGLAWDFDGALTRAHPTPYQQISTSMTTMWDTITAVVSPKSEIGLQHLSGPVGIMHAYYILFERQDGWLLALWFSVVLNVNLALLNLLPIPVLDGGHITLAIIEGIIRRPVNVRILEFLQSGFAILLIGFMLYVTFFDFIDLGRNRGPAEPPGQTMKFAEDPAATPAP